MDLLPICFQIMEGSLRKFAAENFSQRYFPALHGEIKQVQPLTLVVKKNRPLWKRPFAKLEVIVLAELAKYVENEESEEFRKCLASKIKKEMLISNQHETITLEARYDNALTKLLLPGISLCCIFNDVCLMIKQANVLARLL